MIEEYVNKPFMACMIEFKIEKSDNDFVLVSKRFGDIFRHVGNIDQITKKGFLVYNCSMGKVAMVKWTFSEIKANLI